MASLPFVRGQSAHRAMLCECGGRLGAMHLVWTMVSGMPNDAAVQGAYLETFKWPGTSWLSPCCCTLTFEVLDMLGVKQLNVLM